MIAAILKIAAAVAVDERGHDALLAQVLDGPGYVRSAHGDGVLDAGLEEVQDVAAALHDDDGVRVVDVGAGGQPVLAAQ